MTMIQTPDLKENKKKTRRFLEEAFGQGKPELVDDLLGPHFVRYDPYIEAEEVRGVQTVKENIRWFRNAFPDLTCTIEDQVAEGDKVVTRYTVRGTHQGEDFFGVPATGERIEMSGIQIDRLEGGKLVEERAEFDLMGALQQLGAVLGPGQAQGA